MFLMKLHFSYIIKVLYFFFLNMSDELRLGVLILVNTIYQVYILDSGARISINDSINSMYTTCICNSSVPSQLYWISSKGLFVIPSFFLHCKSFLLFLLIKKKKKKRKKEKERERKQEQKEGNVGDQIALVAALRAPLFQLSHQHLIMSTQKNDYAEKRRRNICSFYSKCHIIERQKGKGVGVCTYFSKTCRINFIFTMRNW